VATDIHPQPGHGSRDPLAVKKRAAAWTAQELRVNVASKLSDNRIWKPPRLEKKEKITPGGEIAAPANHRLGRVT
jgi:hypothetical protein